MTDSFGGPVAHLTSDEEDLQRVACDTDLLDKIIALAKTVDKEDAARPIAENIKARQKEVRLCTGSSLCKGLMTPFRRAVSWPWRPCLSFTK